MYFQLKYITVPLTSSTSSRHSEDNTQQQHQSKPDSHLGVSVNLVFLHLCCSSTQCLPAETYFIYSNGEFGRRLIAYLEWK